MPRVRSKTTLAVLLALFLCLFWTSACSEVESCKESGDLGCINTMPRVDGGSPCLFDLVLRGDRCVKPGSVEDKCSLCAPGTLCVPERNECVNFCEPPAVIPGSGATPMPIYCEAFDTDEDPNTNPMLTFEDVCTRRCRLRCQKLQQFCPGYECPAGTCDSPDVQARCLGDCPLTASGGKDLACLTSECNNERFARCDKTIMCPNMVPAACATVTCTNDCMFAGYAGDGICDDGDLVSSSTAHCAWGSDCADCGPRPGTQPVLAALGGLCQYALNCEGGTGSPADATAWCFELASIPGSQRCVPDCSRGQKCPDTFECVQLLQHDDATNTDTPVVDRGITGQACRPTFCQ